MATSVVEQGEIIINGVFYRIAKGDPFNGRVQDVPVSVYPEKQVFGDYTRDSGPLSVMSFSDFRGGIGLDIMEGFVTDRCWASNCNIRTKRSLVLGPLISTTGVVSDTAGNNRPPITEHNGTLYMSVLRAISGDREVYSYVVSTDTWASVHSLGNVALSIDAINFELAGTEYIAFSSRTDYSYYNGTSWADSTTNVDFFTFWDDRFWGIDSTGQMWYALTPGTEVNVAKLPVSSGTPVGMIVYRNQIYVIARRGLFAYDAANDRFIEASFPTPLPFLTAGREVWRDNLYISSGQTMYEYSLTGGAAEIRSVGPDKDDGFASSVAGVVTNGLHLGWLAGSKDELYALARGETLSGGNVVDWAMLAWDGRSWTEIETVQVGTTSSTPGTIHVSQINDVYQLWVGDEADSPSNLTRMRHFTIPAHISNPKLDGAYTYAAAATLKTPWFHADQVNVSKLAKLLEVETSDTSANETVKIEYAVDYDEGSSDANYLTLANSTFTDGVIDTTTSGVTLTTFELPKDTADVSVNPVGKAFKSIRFKVSLARGGTTTNSPKLISMTLSYRKKLARKEGFRVGLDLTEGYKNNTVNQLRTALQTAKESETLVLATFRDADIGDRNYYVDVFDEGGEEETGHNEEGVFVVRLVEV